MLVCEGGTFGADDENNNLQISFLDLNEKVIQASPFISNTKRMRPIEFSSNISLLEKKFNFPGFEAHYLFNITLDENISLNKGRVYVQYSLQMPARFNVVGKLKCFINNISTMC